MQSWPKRSILPSSLLFLQLLFNSICLNSLFLSVGKGRKSRLFSPTVYFLTNYAWTATIDLLLTFECTQASMLQMCVFLCVYVRKKRRGKRETETERDWKRASQRDRQNSTCLILKKHKKMYLTIRYNLMCLFFIQASANWILTTGQETTKIWWQIRHIATLGKHQTNIWLLNW